MQTILLAFSSSNEYVPYLAQWPILSLLPSPPSTSSVPLSWLIRDVVHFSHTCLMVLWRYLSWWRKYVLGWIPITPMSLSTLSVFPGIAPANRIDAERRMFPAGMPQTYGWLSHFHSFPHVLHVWTTVIMVPMTLLMMARALVQWQATQIVNSCKRAVSNMMNFLSSVSGT